MIDYCNADTILPGEDNVAIPPSIFDPSTIKDTGRGWPKEGPGRAEGSGSQLRQSLDHVLFVMFETAACKSLMERSDSSIQTLQSLTGLQQVRRRLKNITYKAVRGSAWELAPSDAVGVVLGFSGLGARDGREQHGLLVATASLA
eukprot:TRINITY_DN7402_c0_g1_i1.p1 TRINITY_DN7402_c0_g1~~TRINITY_DN7402_c0_g1_i1.p1  ORF type:complete len:145 (+),score=28.13 TRINITY_DN7402_c0_g1_i1:584-1018(+)